MEPTIIDVIQDAPYGLQKIDSSISFRNFINFLEEKAGQEQTVKKTFFSMVLDRLRSNPAFSADIDINDIADFREELSLVYGMLMPPVTNEDEVFWALSTPISPVVFYGTSGFYKLMTDNSGCVRCEIADKTVINVKQKMKKLYSFILERLYHFPPLHENDLIIALNDDKTGLKRFYRANLDTRFADVYAKGSLPELDLEEIRKELQESNEITVLSRLLPLSMFRFEGFSVITFTDVTAEHAVDNIKSAILDRASYDANTYFSNVTDALKMLACNSDIDFGLLPVLRVNNKLVFDRSTVLFSKLMSAALADERAEDMYLSMANQYFQAPKVLFMRNLAMEDESKQDFIRILRNDGVESYALLPVYYDSKAIGVLEVYSKSQKAIDERVLARLDAALPFIGQMMKYYIDEFNVEIDNVIREKFTSLQPAVQWRFRETAWHYLRDKSLKMPSPTIENIQFRNVYPLYGAIDIRNSTLERNAALRDDLHLQFDLLIETFTILKQKLGFGLADEMIYKCKKWIDEIDNDSTDSDEMRVRDFLEYEAHPFLVHFKEARTFQAVAGASDDENEELVDVIDKYFEITDEHTGAAYSNRRALEASMQKVNSSVNLYLDLFRKEIQQSYPCYFEKFRTDGIEYDIYIGQSIEPEKKFSELYLKNIRLWQLTSMAAIAKITNSLIYQMDKPLQTTQLIFIHSSSIDISFRDDERRFDVEGAYNIRYQVIKKRIDKVHIKGTGERLTQPGKIALVYFNSKSAEEYVGYIRYLQEKKTLNDDLEFLDLEELQGVTGLKALRIGVNLQSEWS
ncbi:GAF domain-containing protein [Dyadobacter fanqingshengii]|uniref:GAF domain-containing protein n=1 Tax=Dyadobacter fanqingshengii TaxID=2906443 RepID=A0A9X1TAK7_9BACT|nr:GAF domain-containing protein [Dyadobacter fanqingshengii]MCF0042695.1 GAF domain-containing protein [Dyadobacter fanqingshengii]USJ36081.1 GAF domain-containing protein [Dyadobacter fanqingshengii]